MTLPSYNPLPTVATGDLWTASNHNTYIRDNFAAGVPAIFTTIGDLAYAAGNQRTARLPIGAVGQILRAVLVGSDLLPQWSDERTVDPTVYRHRATHNRIFYPVHGIC